jgi:ribosome-binding protein aMBF1 (putative translation factor)
MALSKNTQSGRHESDWIDEARFIKKNRPWLKNSLLVALHVMDALEEKGWTQKKLADELGVTPQQVSKIVKGRENLTFETVSNLEKALNIKLMSVRQIECTGNYDGPKMHPKVPMSTKVSDGIKHAMVEETVFVNSSEFCLPENVSS